MTQAAFTKIMEGLQEALAVSRGEVTGARLHRYLNGRKLRADVTADELARLEKYGAVEFESAGAKRKR